MSGCDVSLGHDSAGTFSALACGVDTPAVKRLTSASLRLLASVMKVMSLLPL